MWDRKGAKPLCFQHKSDQKCERMFLAFLMEATTLFRNGLFMDPLQKVLRYQKMNLFCSIFFSTVGWFSWTRMEKGKLR